MQGAETLNIQAPYPGLRSFDPSEKDFFFGRERQLDELLRKLRSTRFLAVVGSNGNGKSSFIKAMLIPRLEEGFNGQAGSVWRIATCTPGNNPLENLSRQLAQRNVLHGDEMMDPSYPAKIETMLRNGSLGIVEAFKKSDVKRGENLMIVVDQFEEIFNFSKKNKRNEEDAATFINLLLNASRQKDTPIYIVLTMRANHIGDCAEFRGLAEAINDGQYLIPRVKPEDIKRIILNPIQNVQAVKRHGVRAEIEEPVIKAIIDDLGKNTDELATLQHLMLRMWHYWLDKEENTAVPMSMLHYKGVGTIKGAMARHAEEAYADLDTEEKRIICERIFRAMVEKGSDGHAASRSVSVKEMMDITGRSMREVRLVIYTFSQSGRRFLNAPPVAEIDEDSIISIAHESLIKRWSRLKGWSNDETEAAEMYGRLCSAASLYYQEKGSLWKEPELGMGLKWFDPEKYDEDFSWRLGPNVSWAKRYENPAISYGKAIEFLTLSEEASMAGISREKEIVERKEKTRRGFGWAAFSVVCFCLIMMIWALWSAADAKRSGYIADKSALEARRQTYLAELSKEEASRQEFYAMLSAEKAMQEKSRAEAANLTAMEAARIAEAKSRQAMDSERRAKVETQKADAEREKALIAQTFAEVKTQEATKAKDEALKSKEIALREKNLNLAQSIAVKSTKEENEDIQGILAKEAYDLNSSSGGDPKDAFIYEAIYKALSRLEEINKNNPDFNTLNLTPEGRNRVGRIRNIQVSPSDGEIYTVGSDGLLLKWKMGIYGSKKARSEKSNKPEILSSNVSVARTLDISPDGKLLARAGDAERVLICDAKSGQTVKQLDAHNGRRVWGLRFIPNGDGIVSLGEDGSGGTAINYTTMGGASSPIIARTPYRATDLDISSDGKYVAAIGKSSEVWIWNLGNQRREFLLNDPQSDKDATAVAFNPQGRFVAVGYQDGTMMVWDLNKVNADPTYLPQRFLEHGAKISDLAFSNDGSMLVVGSLDKKATLWNIRNEKFRGGLEKNEFPYLDPKYHPIKLTNHTDWVTSVAFNKNGTKVITGTANGELKIWEVDMTMYADQICEIIRQNLSDNSWKKYVGTDDPNGEILYIETPDGSRRIPLSTCGLQIPQMNEKRKLKEN